MHALGPDEFPGPLSRLAGRLRFNADTLWNRAHQIARINGEALQAHGAEAARRFRLTTQAPTAPVLHASGSSRTIRVAGVTVRMIHTSNRRRLQFAGEATGVALSALWHLGKNNVTPESVAAIETALHPAAFEKLRSADMPVWMQKAFADAARESARG
ncbi:MAG: hypothetical protein F4X97_13050 [Boseongicola sp. SB0662_bin_57]|nr:hypothetical protein [Boseongicola sp. SB0662_bin_57]